MYVIYVDIMDRKRIENLRTEDSGDIRGGKETPKRRRHAVERWGCHMKRHEKAPHRNRYN